MDLKLRLRESNSRLIKLENRLDSARDELINHSSLNNNMLSNGTDFHFLSSIERYSGFADDCIKELSHFQSLLQEIVNEQKSNLIPPSAINNYIISDHLSQHTLSTPVSNISYTNNDDSNSSMNSKDVAAISSYPGNDNVDESEQEEEEEKENEKVLTIPSLNKKAKVVRAKIVNNLGYKYGGKGFDVWRKNGKRAIYTSTTLRCFKTFGADKAGIDKLQKYLNKKGGLRMYCVQNITIKQNNDGDEYGLIKVRDSQQNIESVVNKINGNKTRPIIKIAGKIQWFSASIERNCKLFVNNFDILRDSDHKSMTDLFLRFGELENDIVIRRDSNGDPYALVQFRYIESAINCEQNQNLRSNYYVHRDPLSFNGRQLNIRYVDTNKENQRSKKRKNVRKSNKSRKY